MKRTLIAFAIAAFAGPALADEPNGAFNFKDNANSQGSLVGQLSSRITQNGQFVSGNCEPVCATPDQTTTPGSRADAVQALQALQGRGRDQIKP